MASDRATSQPTTTSTNRNHPTTAPPAPAPANQNRPTTTTPRGETDPYTSRPAPEGGASAGTEADPSEAREGSGVKSGTLPETGTTSVATGTTSVATGTTSVATETGTGVLRARGTCPREGSDVSSELTEGWTERIRENMEEIEVEEAEAEEVVVVAAGEVLGQVEELKVENRRERGTEGVGRLDAPLRRRRWRERCNLDQPGSEKEVLTEVMENE
ncbi:unnamed protein product [Boreogadus saida]